MLLLQLAAALSENAALRITAGMSSASASSQILVCNWQHYMRASQSQSSMQWPWAGCFIVHQANGEPMGPVVGGSGTVDVLDVPVTVQVLV